MHRVALGSRLVGQASFDLEETTATRRGQDLEIVKPVFICGLARSGSTILLNALYQTGHFRSLTYRDMPFVLMSGLWRKLYATSRIQREARERAHGDRIMVNYDSPEAFEEVFWRIFYGDKYIFPDRVVPHHAPQSVREKFCRFVHHVLASREGEGQTRYLSKNNNNMLRLPTLRRVFEDAVIIVPFREPLQQAQSLLRQHQLFTDRHKTDRFSLDYMNWLGHYEFGLGLKHYAYTEADNPFAPADINYWLQCWLDTYKFALQYAPDDAVFLGYEQVCAAPLAILSAIFPLLSLPTDASSAAAFYQQAEPHDAGWHTDELLEACQRTYKALIEKHQENIARAGHTTQQAN
jgi:LPS sulfotransferase NodH